MSASLVGSEMCIRDRPNAVSALPVEQVATSWPLLRLWSCRASGAPPTAVSYTHLTLPTICSV
eukprot:8618035-Alexandrium_andersonii.AAC.1